MMRKNSIALIATSVLFTSGIALAQTQSKVHQIYGVYIHTGTDSCAVTPWRANPDVAAFTAYPYLNQNGYYVMNSVPATVFVVESYTSRVVIDPDKGTLTGEGYLSETVLPNFPQTTSNVTPATPVYTGDAFTRKIYKTFVADKANNALRITGGQRTSTNAAGSTVITTNSGSGEFIYSFDEGDTLYAGTSPTLTGTPDPKVQIYNSMKTDLNGMVSYKSLYCGGQLSTYKRISRKY